jgi:hypothetical protein
LAALPQFGQVAVLIYPVAGVVVWIWLFFDLPIGIRFFGSLAGLIAGAVLGTLVGMGFSNIAFAAVVGGCIGVLLSETRRLLYSATYRRSLRKALSPGALFNHGSNKGQ